MARIYRVNADGSLVSTTYTLGATEITTSDTATFNGTIANRASAPWNGKNVFVLSGASTHNYLQSDAGGIIPFVIEGRLLAVVHPNRKTGFYADVLEFLCDIGETNRLRIRTKLPAIFVEYGWDSGTDYAVVEVTGLTLPDAPIVIELILDAANATAANRLQMRWWALGDTPSETWHTATGTGGAAAVLGNEGWSYNKITLGHPTDDTPSLEVGLVVIDDDPDADLSSEIPGAVDTTPTVSSVTPSTVTPSSNPVIAGTNFEATQGTGTVKISPTDNVADAAVETQAITSWGDTSITLNGVTFPTGTAHNDTLYLFVTNNSGETNAAGYQLTADLAPQILNEGVINVTGDGFQLQFDSTVANGIAYYVIFPTSVAFHTDNPTGRAQVRDGLDSTGAAGTTAGQMNISTTGQQTFPAITGLSPGQHRYAIVHDGTTA